jgi:hypothetical protein
VDASVACGGGSCNISCTGGSTGNNPPQALFGVRFCGSNCTNTCEVM